MSASRLTCKFFFHNARYFANCAVFWFTATMCKSESLNYVLVAAGGVSSYEVLVVGKAA
jgi:hypothetical protein